MNKRYLPLALGLLFLSSCAHDNSGSQTAVVSQRFQHKYGYAVSKEEWNEKNYPGQVISTMSNGVTINATYENKVLHGPCTHTYPNSQTVHYFYLYNQGNPVKSIVYDTFGMPMKEQVQLSPQRYTLTQWYGDGTPMSIEDYASDELLEGEYMTVNNEIESRVEKGNGLRVVRDQKGTLLSKDQFQNGSMVKRESFYSSGIPESIIHYSGNRLHGEKRTFSDTGVPLVIEEWVGGRLHGKCTYFTNGVKQTEIHYLHGAKNGPEIHYLDGKTVAQQILWENDRRHGPTVYYIDGLAQNEYWYEGKKVTQKKYQELDHLDRMITQVNE